MLLADNVAVVTGGAAGIGSAIARRFSSEGAAVVIADIDAARGHALVESLDDLNTEVVAVETDIARPSETEALVGTVLERFGRIDVLVNNAGVTRPAGLLSVTPAEWDLIMGINARGAFFCMQAAARSMKDQGRGCIVNVASIAAKGWPHSSSVAYAASKAAMVAITRIASYELAAYGIRVNAVCPGLTDTELFRGRIEAVAADEGISVEEAQERFGRWIPLGRLTTPEEIASVAVFLASRQSGTMTGQSLNVDGGIVFD